MDHNSARIILGDEAAITALAARSPDKVEAVRAALAATKQVPAIINEMGEALAAVAADPLIEMRQGCLEWVDGEYNFENEPAKALFRNALKYASSSEKMGNAGRWLLGNIACLMEEAGFDISELIEASDLAYNTVITSMTTFKFFRHKRYPKLPFSHHKEIAYGADLSVDQKHAIAAYAEEQQLSLVAVRGLIKLTQQQVRDNAEDLGFEPEPPEVLHAKLELNPATIRRFVVITGTGSRIVDRAPAGAEMEEALEVYEIRRIIKPRAFDGGAGPPAEPDGEAGDAAEPDEPGADG